MQQVKRKTDFIFLLLPNNYIFILFILVLWHFPILKVGFFFSSTSPLILGGFPCGSDSKESACNSGDPDSPLGLGRSPGEGNGNPLQYSCLQNSMDRGAWWATDHEVSKSWTWLSVIITFLYFLPWFHDISPILKVGLFFSSISSLIFSLSFISVF